MDWHAVQLGMSSLVAASITSCLTLCLTHAEDAFEAAQRGLAGLGQDLAERDALEVRPHDQPVGLSTHNDVGELFAAKPRVDRQNRGAYVRARQKGLHPCQAVGQPDGDAIQFADSKPRQVASQALRLGVQRRETDGLIAVYQGRVIRILSGQTGHALRKKQGIGFHLSQACVTECQVASCGLIY